MNCLYCELHPIQRVDQTCLCDSCNLHLALGDLVVSDRPGVGRVIRWREGDPTGPECPDAGASYYPELSHCDQEDESYLSRTLEMFVLQLARRRTARAVVRQIEARGCRVTLAPDDALPRLDKPGRLPWGLLSAFHTYIREIEDVTNDAERKRSEGVRPVQGQ